jgi:release factor glutamine methyltransferase
VATERRSTIGGAVEEGIRRLARAGLTTPRRDVERIVADLLDLTPGGLTLERARELDADRRAILHAAFERRAAGEPIQYVTGLAGFRRLTLRADRRALIPRPETEGLVELALVHEPTGIVADIGTGSACIALALRDEGRFGRVIGIDRSVEALGLAAANSRPTGQVKDLVTADLTTGLGSDALDLLIANPPYVTAAEYAGLDPGVRDYEPRPALESGRDGLDATRRLVIDGLRVVRPGGWIAIELASERAREAGRLAADAGWDSVRIEDDLFGRPRYLLARREALR